MTDSLPTLLSLRQAASASILAVLGARIDDDGEVDWRDVPGEQRGFAERAAALAEVAITMLYGHTEIREAPRSAALEFVAECFRDDRFVGQVVSLAHRVDVAHGRRPGPSSTH